MIFISACLWDIIQLLSIEALVHDALPRSIHVLFIKKSLPDFIKLKEK